MIIKFSMYGQGGHQFEINIHLQNIFANSRGGGLIIEGGVISSEYGNSRPESLMLISESLWTISVTSFK